MSHKNKFLKQKGWKKGNSGKFNKKWWKKNQQDFQATNKFSVKILFHI